MKKILFSTFQVMGMQGFAQVSKFCSRMLLTRILSVSAFGKFSFIFLWAILLAPILNLGNEKLITKEVSAEDSAKGLGVTIYSVIIQFMIGLLLLIIAYLFTDLICNALKLLEWQLYSILIFAFISAILSSQFALLNGLSKPVIGRVVEFLVIPALMIAFLGYRFLYAQETDLELVITGFLLIYAIGLGIGLMLVYKFFVKQFRSFKPDFSQRKKWIKFSSSNFLSGTSITYMAKMDFLFVGLLMSAEQVGLYAIPSNIFGTLNFLNLAFNLVMEPKTSSFYKQGKLNRLLPFLRSNIYLQLLISVVIYATVYFLGDYILLLFGEAYTEMQPILMITVLVLIVNALTGPAPMLLTMTGRVDKKLKANLFSMILAIVLYPLAIDMYGLFGAAYVFVFSMTLTRMIQVFYVYKVLGINFLKLLI